MSEGRLRQNGGVVGGVDGCPGGWVVVLRSLASAADAEVRIFRHFADVLAIKPAPVMLAVDMPIGLPERVGIGGRPADIAARANLGQRQSSVFAVPARAAVMETDYRAACDAAFRHSDPPRKVSKQTFFLFPKIREIDVLMTPDLQARVVEVHPELAFWALNGEAPLAEPKKVKGRPHAAGLALRADLLVAAGYDRRLLTWKHAPASQVGPDDVLDAAANSWSAVRIADGAGRVFPAEPARDARGLRMEIRC